MWSVDPTDFSALFSLQQAGLSRRWHRGQHDGLDQAATVAVVDGDIAAAADDDLPRDGEAQAGARDRLTPAGIDAEERLEYLLQQIARNAGATVGDDNGRNFAPNGYFDGGAAAV